MDDRLCFPYKDDKKNTLEFADDIMQVYDRMKDNISRDIFANRLLFSLTGNHVYLKNVLLHTAGGNKLNDLLQKDENPKYIYGAGIRGRRLMELFPDVWNGCIDMNRRLENYHNVKIVDLERFMGLYTPGTIIVVSNMSGTDEIVENLHQKRIAAEDIYVLNDFDQESVQGIYFAPECIGQTIEKEKCFIDIGCFDGKDSLNYLKWSNNSEAIVYAFEPDIRNYRVCRENLDAYPNIELFNMGLSDVEEEVGILGEGEMAYLGTDGDLQIQTQLLDNLMQDKPIGYIKMDVEGYEEHVLRGAREIIHSQCPILAVSIYHKKSDIWRIPKLLLEINNNYSFYMRHYSAANGDTVLYAINSRE